MLQDLNRKIHFSNIEEEILLRQISLLPEMSAKVLVEYYVEGKSFNEIAELLKRSPSSIRSYHSRGIFLLTKYFGKQ